MKIYENFLENGYFLLRLLPVAKNITYIIIKTINALHQKIQYYNDKI